ncbi:MAG TPA: glycosyltransferase family 4 protein [Terriglobales bacterium]|nr:glycosyltransferase family 4 protein [Terriglobales bacterium]
MRILYVCQYFPPEMGAPAARASELAKYWASEGHEVTVLTAFPNHPTGQIHPAYRSKFHRMLMREKIGGVEVVRTWLLPFPNRHGYERMLNYSSFCLSASAAGICVRRPDVIIASSPQLLVGLCGLWLATWKRVPLIFEVRDLWPESLAAVGFADPKSPLNRTLSIVAGLLYERADHIVVVSPAFQDRLTRYWGVPPEKISVIENGVETEIFSPSARDEALRAQLGLADQFVVGYIGTIGVAHGLDMILQAATVLQQQMPEVIFLIVGEGAERERLETEVRSRGLANIRIVGQQPRERIPDFINACHAGLVTLRKAELFKTVIPTKMLEFMSCAKPVLLGVDGQAREILERANAGMFFEPESSSALISSIRRLRSTPALGGDFGNQGRQYILKHFTRQQSAADYLRVMEGLTPCRREELAPAGSL